VKDLRCCSFPLSSCFSTVIRTRTEPCFLRFPLFFHPPTLFGELTLFRICQIPLFFPGNEVLPTSETSSDPSNSLFPPHVGPLSTFNTTQLLFFLSFLPSGVRFTPSLGSNFGGLVACYLCLGMFVTKSVLPFAEKAVVSSSSFYSCFECAGGVCLSFPSPFLSLSFHLI